MHKILLTALLGLALSGCASITDSPDMDISGLLDAEPVAFPHPGVYGGSTGAGVAVYGLRADGTGLMCFSNQYSGRIVVGDAKYDGERLYTQTGTFQVVSVSEAEIVLRAFSNNTTFRRVDTVPTVCREFLAEL